MASSQFSPGEIGSIIIAWVVISIAISIGEFYNYFSGATVDLAVVAGAFIATFTGFVLHEMGHKFVAIRHGYVAHFQIWTLGLVLTLVTAVAFQGTFLFGAPGAVYITPAAAAGYYGSNYYSRRRMGDPAHENMVISAAGPGMNLAFALVFLVLMIMIPINGFVTTVETIGFSLNVGLGSFNMLPIPPMDGSKIFRNNIAVALAIALPLWGMFLYFFLPAL
jgi:Zn-dependent protease